MGRKTLVLASASATRVRLLQAAGVAFTADPAALDEGVAKAALKERDATASEAAEALALLKAREVATRHPDALVLGADQMLECDGRWYDKPACGDDARRQLIALRGRRHTLASAVVAVRGGERLWECRDEAHLTMRPFSDAFLDDYLESAGAATFASVGAYQLEGLGAQLFARVEGDHFTILGLPLLPLLGFLRGRGMLAT